MLDTRRRLQQLLDRDKISANLLAEISKVPAPTIYRFLNGDIGEPRSSTICKLAEALKVSEAQMRGIDPVAGLDDILEVSAPVTLESVLTPDELIAIEGMRGHSKDIRHAWLLIGKELCAARKVRKKGEDQRTMPDRRRGGMRSLASGSNKVKYAVNAAGEGMLGEPKKA